MHDQFNEQNVPSMYLSGGPIVPVLLPFSFLTSVFGTDNADYYGFTNEWAAFQKLEHLISTPSSCSFLATSWNTNLGGSFFCHRFEISLPVAVCSGVANALVQHYGALITIQFLVNCQPLTDLRSLYQAVMGIGFASSGCLVRTRYPNHTLATENPIIILIQLASQSSSKVDSKLHPLFHLEASSLALLGKASFDKGYFLSANIYIVDASNVRQCTAQEG
ncbi:hypothetical protein Tco_0005853 [Tanacetum coccineum]